ncbi:MULTISPECIES: ABC transporter substrate-binding protein [Halomonas]|uniref:ABC transporter substrate-binding protein n=1 Tax=Halomonas TaxID=2745 RepID=UPI001C967AF3|nr:MULTISPECIES: ABC transporter substrate-binding protein [Halomonas]MBY6208991.1 ABC transporter substrate-binding protein [Halomonas sp. DP3Y7-2]MBY6227461.1 ABC transporter substrate-binding protein [Halomonas sp. DP3Y7-1]MCA0914788.1 ABC transporter substrate-binding protein [Halomonas denitrificans]
MVSSPRIASASWPVTETLLALGVTPMATADIPGYDKWVVEPPIPDGVKDLGLRNQPHLELLALDPPDLLLTSDLFSGDNARLSRITPVKVMNNFATGQPYLEATIAMTREIARLSGTQQQAETLVSSTLQHLADTRDRLSGNPRELYVIRLIDERHVQVFGEHSMLEAVFDQTALTNAWQGPTNSWGFAQVPISLLAENPQAEIVIIAPIDQQVLRQLPTNEIWRRLPAVREGRVTITDPIWLYSGLRSFQRLLEQLEAHLSTPDVQQADAR